MVWPWEQFSWGIFWAIIAAFAIRGIVRGILNLIAAMINS